MFLKIFKKLNVLKNYTDFIFNRKWKNWKIFSDIYLTVIFSKVKIFFGDCYLGILMFFEVT